jgi:hypothetical protein
MFADSLKEQVNYHIFDLLGILSQIIMPQPALVAIKLVSPCLLNLIFLVIYLFLVEVLLFSLNPKTIYWLDWIVDAEFIGGFVV